MQVKYKVAWSNTMRVVERTRPIDVTLNGYGLSYVAEALKAKFPKIEITESDDDYILAEESEWYNSIKLTPGDHLKIRRENKGMTQKALSEKTGISVSNISAMEHDRRPIGAKTARLFAKAIGCTVSQILGE